MNRNINFLTAGVHRNFNGRGAQYLLDRNMMKLNPDRAINEVAKKYEEFLKLNKMTRLPIYMFPKQANRLMERPRPHEKRNMIRKESLRKRDRAIIKAYCDFFMFTNRRYKPH